MNGDEDLGQDIIMKGDKFHYQQEMPQVEMSIMKPECVYEGATAKTPKNGPVGINCVN